MISGRAIIAVSVCLAAYLCIRWRGEAPKKYLQPKERIISAWHEQISAPDGGFRRVALGINACVDLIVNGTQLLSALGVPPGGQVNHGSMKTLKQLQEAFHHHFASGAGGERYFSDDAVFQEVVSAAAKLEGGQWYVGGNAALIGQNIAAAFPDVQVQLVAPVGPRLLDLLDGNIAVPESSLVPVDEVHLIMEYLVGERWGGSVAKVATRFITSHDESNGQVRSLEPMFETLSQFQPDLLVFSGLHMLEGQDSAFWWKRMGVLGDRLDKLPRSLPVHLELASMANAKLVKAIASQILHKVSSLGLNEQELIFASHLLGGPHRDIYDSRGQPIIHKITDTVAWLMQRYGHSPNKPTSKLTRVHFHTLSYHLIGVVPGVWSNSAVAVAAGTERAGRQACDTASLDPENTDLKIPTTYTLFSGDEERTFSYSQPVTSFTHESLEFAFSPVLVCKQPLKTVGLGDAISATGLLYSSFSGQYQYAT